MGLHLDSQKLGKLLVKRKQTLALAESCTGGLLSSIVTDIPGSSKYFIGSIVSYANSVKCGLLNVDSYVLRKIGAVSEEAALQMARGAKRRLKSDWAASITGIAGPSGGTKTKPVGLVYCAVVGPGVEVVKKSVFKGNRQRIRRSAAKKTLSLLIDQII